MDEDEEYFYDMNHDSDESIMIYDSYNDDGNDDIFDSEDDDESSMQIYNNRFYYEIFEEINSLDRQYIETDKVTGGYYLGQYVYVPYGMKLLMATSVSSNAFFLYSYKIILDYLRYYNFLLYKSDMKLHILQVCVQNDMHYVIVKTFWIKIIQRKWRTIYQKRKMILRERIRIQTLDYTKIHGRYPRGLNVLPKLYGMLRDLIPVRPSQSVTERFIDV